MAIAPLFSPLMIGKLSLGNRIVMPPMALAIATEEGKVTPQQIEHYTLPAKASPAEDPHRPGGNYAEAMRPGVGLIIVEHAYVSQQGKAHPRQLGIYDDVFIPGLMSLAEAVHQEGAKIGIQISHAGARAMENPKAPSSIPLPFLSRPRQASEGNPEDDLVPEQFSFAELEELSAQFAQAARRAQQAGFDLVEIHGAHGYLLNQFYSPLTNQRQDAYGGSLENRLRFPLAVIRAVREAVGPDFPIFYRLGADDRMAGGTTLDHSRQAAPWLVSAGVDALDLSGGLCGYLTHGPEGFFLYLAEAIKPTVNVPVIVTGGIKTAQFANRIIEEGQADLVGIGRALLKDPEWAQKACVELSWA